MNDPLAVLDREGRGVEEDAPGVRPVDALREEERRGRERSEGGGVGHAPILTAAGRAKGPARGDPEGTSKEASPEPGKAPCAPDDLSLPPAMR